MAVNQRVHLKQRETDTTGKDCENKYFVSHFTLCVRACVR